MWLIALLTFIVSLVLVPLYVVYKMSGYSKVSKHSFLVVHISLFLDESSWLLRRVFRSYLWLYHEYCIYSKLESMKGYGKILANLYIPQWMTVTDTEIDILFIHESGIYCIEAKDFAGYISWGEYDTLWSQKFGRRLRYTFPNPLRQNCGHIKSLEKLIPFPIESLVVFSWRSKISTYLSEGKVIQRHQMKKYFWEKKEIIFSKWQIDQIYETLVPYSHSSKEQESKHIQEIHEHYAH